MVKLATKPANKLQRIQSGITEAQSEIDSLQGQIQTLDDQISSELGKVTYDKQKVATMEGERQELVKGQSRLSARITALQKTIPAAEKVLAKSELKDGVVEHSEAVDKVNQALEAYKEGFDLLRTFVELWHSLVDARIMVGGARDKVDYYSALLELEQPELKTANNLTREEDEERARVIHACIPMRPDPYRTSEFSEKLKKLNEERQEKEQAIRAKKAREEAILAR